MTKKAFLVLAVVIAVLRWQTWTLPLNRDEGAYAYMASRLFDGDFVLYRDAFEHKPPGIHLLYWLSFRLLGESEFTVRFLSYVNILVGTVILVQILKHFGLSGGRLNFLTAFYLLLSNSFVLEGGLANTEMFMVTFLAGGLLMVIWQKPLWAGLLAAAAVLFKPVAAVNVFVLGLALVFFSPRKTLSDIFLFLLGAAAPVLAVVFWFYSLGALADLYAHVVNFNRFYIASGLEDVGAKIGFLAWLWRGHLLARLLLISGLIVFFVNRKSNKRWSLIMFLWFLAYFVGAKITSRNVLHYYYPLIQGTVLLLAATYQKKVARSAAFIVFTIFIFSWGWLYFVSPRVAYAKTFGSTVRYAYDGRGIGRAINRATQPDDRIFFWLDEPEILFYSRRLPSTRYINTFGTVLPGGLAGLKSGLIPPPRVLVTYGGTEPDWLLAFLSAHVYTPDQTFSSARIYWRQ